MSLTPEEQTFIAQMRLRSAPGSTDPPTLDEMKRTIIILRGSRKAAIEASSIKRSTKAKVSEASVNDMLADLENL